MTEYTGWDNYVKAEERKCGGGIRCKKYPSIHHLPHDECDVVKELFDSMKELQDLQKRVKDLEHSISFYPDSALLRESAAQFNQRIIDLEHKASFGIGSGLDKKVKDLEDKYKDLQEDDVYERVKDLEEWKQQVLNDFDLVRKLTNQKVIDKQVWEDIMNAARTIMKTSPPNGLISPYHEYYLGPLKLSEAIKKADPSWCKDD